ncbi:hypothetical protein [Bacillus tropicus]
MSGVSANNLLKTNKIREDKLRMILEKAEDGDPKALKVLEGINRMLKQV